MWLFACGLTACGRVGFTGDCDGVHDGSAGTTAAANVAFVTSTLQSPMSFGSDLTGADAVCNTRAQAAGLTGTFVAFLSTSTVNARDRLAGSRGWARIDGVPLLDQADDAMRGHLLSPLAIDELGNYAGADFVATGSTGTADVLGGWTCNDYTDGSAMVEGGVGNFTSGLWLMDNNQSCASMARIYCFGLGKTAPVAPPPVTGRLQFMTVESYVVDGNGLATADALCNSEAQQGSLPGSYKALLATSTASAFSRFSAGSPWQRVDGMVLSPSLLDLEQNEMFTTPNLSATGAAQGDIEVMTGIINPAQANTTGQACGDWTAPGGQGLTGRSDFLGSVFNDAGTTIGCTTQPIYCFEE